MFCYIYKLIKKNVENDDMIYIGSACDIDERWRCHKKSCNNPNNKLYNTKVYNYIRDNGGIEEWKMVILDEFEIPLKKCAERDIYEKEYILKYDAINKLNAILTGRKNKEYYENNKEKIKEKYENNKEKIKEYYENNKDKIKEYRKNNKEKIKEYYENNKEKNKDKIKEYRENNKDKIKDKAKEYYEQNKEKMKEYNNEKIICPNCGAVSSRNHLVRHKKSNKCINFVKCN